MQTSSPKERERRRIAEKKARAKALKEKQALARANAKAKAKAEREGKPWPPKSKPLKIGLGFEGERKIGPKELPTPAPKPGEKAPLGPIPDLFSPKSPPSGSVYGKIGDHVKVGIGGTFKEPKAKGITKTWPFSHFEEVNVWVEVPIWRLLGWLVGRK